MPSAVPLDGSGMLGDSPAPLLDDHDVHAFPVLSIHDPMYYTDCSPFPPALSPPYPPQDSHSDLHFVLHTHSNPHFANDSPHVSPKHLPHPHDLTLRGPALIHDTPFHSVHPPPSLTYLPPLHNLVCPVELPPPPFAPSSPPPKPGLAHTLLPPIVQSNPADLARSDIEASLSHLPPSGILFVLQSRPAIKRAATSSASQVDPCAAAFLRDQLGEARWNTFSARLFERRLGPIKLKVRVRGKNPSDDASPPPGATAIDFLVKVEVVKEVLRTYVPHPYNPLKSLNHPYPPSQSGIVTLTRSTVLVLSGWSNTQFSYWARRAEGISVLAAHDERLRAVAVALQKRINAGGVLLDDVDEFYFAQGCPSVTGKGLDIIIDEVKKRTGLSPFLRGKHSSLDPFGSTNSDKDAGPGPPQGAYAAPVYMPTFQAMEYSHAPVITASAESPIGCRPRKKRRISVADSVSSYGSSSGLKVDPSDKPTNHYSFHTADNPRLTPDQESVSSSDMQPTSPPSTILLPQLLDPARVDENEFSPYEISSLGMCSTDDGRPEYFPVSNSRSDLDHSDSENFPQESFSRKRYCGLTKRNLEKCPKLSA